MKEGDKRSVKDRLIAKYDGEELEDEGEKELTPAKKQALERLVKSVENNEQRYRTGTTSARQKTILQRLVKEIDEREAKQGGKKGQ